MLMQDIRLATIFHPKVLPWMVLGWCMIGPTPCALTMHQMKKVIPAMGTTTALTVNKCRLQDWSGRIVRQLTDAHILCIGNQIAGREMSQNRKKHIKSRVVVPDEAGRWFAEGVSVRRASSYKLVDIRMF